MNKTVIIIPSRMSAIRLKGKPLLEINNLPIICHVVKRAKETDRVTFKEVGARLIGNVLGFIDGLKAGTKALIDEDYLADPFLKVELARKKAIPGLAGKIIRTPTRFLGAEDLFFNIQKGFLNHFPITGYTDSFTFDAVRIEMEQAGKIKNEDLNDGRWAGSRKARHPFINSELGQYMDHMKGYDRKAQMSSKKRDLTTKQTHPYWKTLKD